MPPWSVLPCAFEGGFFFAPLAAIEKSQSFSGGRDSCAIAAA
ncbi:hypothetical protein DSM3645_11816 [Blastopirellula marina DSM 3645]|uniref:Uncharacterized protein n=1 Tax=Blastopirellula marina DSM 3645 TaxID=314230 RepID=A3ZRD3_9BACT|nr:hypothetical protein DSM3645_11816 [Blastopirellula marina DSM 3645]